MSKKPAEVKTKTLHMAPQFNKRQKKMNRKEKGDEEQSEEEIDELTDLQSKIKRQPSLWREEFKKHLVTFKKLFLEYREDPSREDEQVVKYIKFMTHISDVYRKDLAFLPTEFVNMLEQNYATIHPNVRLELVQSLRMVRTKKLASATDILPLFFRLFR
jgi:protein SDA1